MQTHLCQLPLITAVYITTVQECMTEIWWVPLSDQSASSSVQHFPAADSNSVRRASQHWLMLMQHICTCEQIYIRFTGHYHEIQWRLHMSFTTSVPYLSSEMEKRKTGILLQALLSITMLFCVWSMHTVSPWKWCQGLKTLLHRCYLNYACYYLFDVKCTSFNKYTAWCLC